MAPAKPSNVTQLFKSTDEGKTWRYVADLSPCLWPVLFVHRGKVYVGEMKGEMFGELS